LKILSVIETGEDSKRSRALATGILNSTEDLLGMYCVGAGRKGIVDALDGRTSGQRPFVIMHDLTDNSQLWLTNDLIDVVIDQNARLVGEQAVIHLLGSIATNSPLLPVKAIEPRIIIRENIPSGRL
ncbi:MAG: LacI family transcriptional regulator, partial [Rhodobacteraceae bacterium]|nr:LacI family transcriptional regulator [Paracoccaceae bacterium]